LFCLLFLVSAVVVGLFSDLWMTVVMTLCMTVVISGRTIMNWILWVTVVISLWLWMTVMITLWMTVVMTPVTAVPVPVLVVQAAAMTAMAALKAASFTIHA
jgi:hypothetical protein